MSDAPDLTTATNEELWRELGSRFNVAVLSYSRDGKLERSYVCGAWYRGTPSESLGVLAWSRINIEETIRDALHDEQVGHEEIGD